MISFGISGRFRLELIDACTGAITQVREFDNLILDTGLNGYGRGLPNNVGKCWVGEGTNPPTPSDLRLQSPLGWGNHSYKWGAEPFTYGTAPDYVSSLTKEYRFGTGAIVGNVAEIGLATGNDDDHSKAVFWCRSLVKNAAGVPEPLPVGSNNILRVFYTIYLHPELSDVSYSFDFDGVTYNCISRPSEIQDSRPASGESSICAKEIEVQQVYKGGNLGAITERIVNYEATKWENLYSYPPSAKPYVEGTFYRDFVQQFPIDYFNIDGGFDGLWITSSLRWGAGASFAISTQVKLDKVIPKNSTNAFNLTLRTSWHRWIDPNA